MLCGLAEIERESEALGRADGHKLVGTAQHAKYQVCANFPASRSTS